MQTMGDQTSSQDEMELVEGPVEQNYWQESEIRDGNKWSNANHWGPNSKPRWNGIGWRTSRTNIDISEIRNENKWRANANNWGPNSKPRWNEIGWRTSRTYCQASEIRNGNK